MKSMLYNIPEGTIDTLPKQDNMKPWSQTFSYKCHLCKNKDSTLHCLNGFKIELHQGRFPWRQDNIITFILNSVSKHKFTLFSVISGHQTFKGGAIPSSMTVTKNYQNMCVTHIASLIVIILTNLGIKHYRNNCVFE